MPHLPPGGQYASDRSTASSTRSRSGRKCSSRRDGGYGVGEAAYPQYRRLHVVEAQLGDAGGQLGAHPRKVCASCTTTHRPVCRTDSVMVGQSIGDSDRTSTTSSSWPSSAATLAASRQVFTIGPYAEQRHMPTSAGRRGPDAGERLASGVRCRVQPSPSSGALARRK